MYADGSYSIYRNERERTTSRCTYPFTIPLANMVRRRAYIIQDKLKKAFIHYIRPWYPAVKEDSLIFKTNNVVSKIYLIWLS